MGLDNAWWWQMAEQDKLGIQRCLGCQTLRHAGIGLPARHRLLICLWRPHAALGKAAHMLMRVRRKMEVAGGKRSGGKQPG